MCHEGTLQATFPLAKGLASLLTPLAGLFQLSVAFVEGLLLYPAVRQPLDLHYRIQGQSLRVVTVDLAADWRDIRQRLLGLLEPT